MEQFATQLFGEHASVLRLLAALLLGMLVGLERGWEARERAAGQRIAGIRTHTLVGLLGGIGVLLGEQVSAWMLPVLLLCVAAFTLGAYRVHSERSGDVSITSIVSVLLTFCFGALAVAGELLVATAAAVVTVILLDNKEAIHALLGKLQSHELDAAFKLLLISAVILPLLPNAAMGPLDALNPFEIWWMVVLIASISFVGYFAVRVWGARRGLLFTSLFAGLSSSTALTLHFARQSRRAKTLNPLLASGILLACGTMFPRILVYCALISPALLTQLAAPVLVMTVALFLPALQLWRRHRDVSVDAPEMKQNPLDLYSALVFGLLLTLIMLGAALLEAAMGDAGIYLLSAASGIADVDAITLSLTRMTTQDLAADTATLAIIIAASVNSLVKALMALFIGTRALGLRVVLPMLVALALGVATAVIF